MNDEWIKCAAMSTQRSSFALIATSHHIYAIGGQSENETLASVERYDITSDVWTDVERMSVQRVAAAAAVFNNFIYVVGGSTGRNSLVTASVERMNLATGKWMQLAQISIARDYLSATIYKNVLYVAGGYNDNKKAVQTVERYDESNDKWMCLPNLVKPNAGSILFQM